jgi:hypothetical protein
MRLFRQFLTSVFAKVEPTKWVRIAAARGLLCAARQAGAQCYGTPLSPELVPPCDRYPGKPQGPTFLTGT